MNIPRSTKFRFVKVGEATSAENVKCKGFGALHTDDKWLAGGAVDFSKLDYYLGQVIKDPKLKMKVMKAIKKAATPLIEELKKLLIKHLVNKKEELGSKEKSKEDEDNGERIQRGFFDKIHNAAAGAFKTVKAIFETPAPTQKATTREPPFKPATTREPPVTTKKPPVKPVTTREPPVTTKKPPVKPTKKPNGCGHQPADIMFVLDESGSIWGDDFKRQLEFVKSVVKIFDVSSKAVHVGVMTFASKVRFIFQMGEKNSYKEIAAAVSKIKQTRGGTFTGDALAFMRNTSFSKQYVRPGVAHVAIIITDGASQQKVKTPIQAKLAKDAGITIFAIGVGKGVKMDEMKALASAPSKEHVFLVNNYKALDALKNKLAFKACEVPTKAPVPVKTTAKPIVTTKKPVFPLIEGCPGKKPVDVVFALPNQLGIPETLATYEFIRVLIKSTEIGPRKIQVGVAKHMCDSTEEIYLNQYSNKNDLLKEVGVKRKGARIDQVIQHMRTVSFGPAHGARTNSSKFGILIVDNKALYQSKTEAEMLLAKQMMQVIVVGVGKNADRVQVSTLASSEKDSFMAKDFADLMTLKVGVLKRLCKVEEKPCSKSKKED